MTKREHKASCEIEAKANRVYEALLDPTILVRWLPPGGATIKIERFEPREGGKFRFILTFGDAIGKSSARDDIVSGHFVRLIPDREVVQAIAFETEDARFLGEMRMCWRMAESSSGTAVSVSAEDVPAGIDQADHQMGMRSSLKNLKSLLESPN